MTDRAGLFPIICVFAMLLAPAAGRAADEPAASAAIPPPAPAATAPVHKETVHKETVHKETVHKATPGAAIHMPPAVAKAAAGSHAKARHATAATRKDVRTADLAIAGRKPAVVAQRHLRHRATLRRPVMVRSSPPLIRRRAYAGVPMLVPHGAPPPMLPPWYHRERPAIAFAYPPPFFGPSGPMPWWVR
jgi:hypothetical protein